MCWIVFAAQFDAYIRSANSIDEFEYVFNARKTAATPENYALIRENFKKIFEKKADEWFSPIDQGGLGATKLEELFGTSNKDIFKTEIIPDLTDPIYDFIKIL